MMKVSVIIPVYNVEEYLETCLQSLIKQTLQDVEFICIDDGSTDRSREILESYAAEDQRFVLLSQHNQGQGTTRNNGIKNARGKYLIFVDSDDYIKPGTLQELYGFAEKYNADMVRFNYCQYNETDGRCKHFSFACQIKKKYRFDLKKIPYYSWRDFKRGCLTELDVHAWLYFFRTDFIRNNNIEFAPARRGEDHLFTNGALLLAEKIYYLDKEYYTYRNRPASTVNSCGMDNMSVFDNIEMMRQFIYSHGLGDELQEEFLDYRKKVLGWHYYQNQASMLGEYEKRCRELLDPAEYLEMLEIADRKKTFWEKIFSIRNHRRNGMKEKVVTIFGFNFTWNLYRRKDYEQQ